MKLENVNNLEDAVKYLFPKFEGMETLIEEYDESEFASFCHSQLSGGIGMKIRNELKLWENETPLVEFLKVNHNLQHPDDMSDLIIREIYHLLKIKHEQTRS